MKSKARLAFEHWYGPLSRTPSLIDSAWRQAAFAAFQSGWRAARGCKPTVRKKEDKNP